MRALVALALAASLLSTHADARPRARPGRGRAPVRILSIPADAWEPTAPFVAQSMDLNGTSHYLDVGTISAFNGASSMTCALWMRYGSSGWTSGNRALISRNVSNQRQFTILAMPRGSLGEMQIGFSAGTTMVSSYIPDGTLSGDWFNHLVVSKSGTTVRTWVDGVEATLQNPSGAYPANLGSSTATIKVGATGSTAASFWIGQLSNVACWAGWAATVTDARALWADGEAIDYRTLAGVPTPTFYIPGNTSPVTEVSAGLTMTGGVNATPSTRIPIDRDFEDAMFERRRLINVGSEPWLPVSGGGIGLYSASPSVVRDSQDRLLVTYSRGVEHITDHYGQILRWNTDELETMPLSNRAYPGQSTNWALFPHGALSGGSKRSFTLSRIPEIGANGRIFTVYNETNYVMPSVATTAVSIATSVATANVASTTNFAVGNWIWTSGHTTNVGQSSAVQITGIVPNTSISYPLTGAGVLADGVGTITRASPERRIWVQYTDDDGSNWSTPYDFAGAGTYWNSVGRARVIRRPDGSLLFGYYHRSFGAAGGSTEGRYVADVARSTDDGVTWAHYATLLISSSVSGGMRWEEPLFDYVDGELMALVRCDSGQDSRINGGASITTGHVVRTVSANDGLTWADPTVAWSGMITNSHPLWFYRDLDGIMISSGQEQEGSGGRAPVLRLSRDKGLTWSEQQRVPSDLTGINMQGQFELSSDGGILYLWAQEWSVTGSPQATAMWSALIRESWIDSVVTP